MCGNTASSTGLTVTMVKDSGTGDFALEAGALVLGDQGVCCIDEFDKMGRDHQALLEAMEQQSISIAKGGIVCTLSARTSVIAAANPVGGHYNRAKTVSENIKMSAAMLSRFDLIFIIMDKPDAHHDAMLSEHVMSLHSSRRGTKPQHGQQDIRQSMSKGRAEWERDKPLSERLRPQPGQPADHLPPELLRKYIAYARKYCHPVLGDAAKKVRATPVGWCIALSCGT